MAIKFFICTGSTQSSSTPSKSSFTAMENAFFALNKGMIGCPCFAEICHYETTPRTKNLIEPFLKKFIKNEKLNFTPIRDWDTLKVDDLNQIEGVIDFILAPHYQKIFCINRESMQLLVAYLGKRKAYRVLKIKQFLTEFSTGSILFFSTRQKWMNAYLIQPEWASNPST